MHNLSLICLYVPVFIDETGTDRRNSFRKEGYSLRGMPARAQKLLAHISDKSNVSWSNTVLEQGGVHGENFIEFIENNLMPVLMPFNGHNPRSVVVMDNCSIYHVDHVTTLLQQIVVNSMASSILAWFQCFRGSIFKGEVDDERNGNRDANTQWYWYHSIQCIHMHHQNWLLQVDWEQCHIQRVTMILIL